MLASGIPAFVLLEPDVPAYRNRLYSLLCQNGMVKVFAGSASRETRDEPWAPTHLSVVHQRDIGRGVAYWMSPSIIEHETLDVIVTELSPRSLIGWELLRRARMNGSFPRVVLWGHAWPRRGETARTVKLRAAMMKMADGLLAYTPDDAQAMIEMAPGRSIGVAPNALYTREELEQARCVEGARRDILFSGRLIPEKRPDLLVEAFRHAAPRLPADVRLVIVGDGPLGADLRASVSARHEEDRIVFVGPTFDFGMIAAQYADAFVAVSPGYAGLSATQATGFGVPFIYTGDEPNAPEVALLDEGNSRRFTGNSATDLARVLVEMYEHRSDWLAKADEIRRGVGGYCIDEMAAGFLQVVEEVARTSGRPAAG